MPNLILGERGVLKKAASGIILLLLFISFIVFTFNFDVKAIKGAWTGTVYIRADGSVDPPDAPIVTYDNITYTLTGNITSCSDGIVVERSNIIINGAHFIVQGDYAGIGIKLADINNLTIINLEIKEFIYGVYLQNSFCITVKWSCIRNNAVGISVDSSSNISICQNYVIYNGHGIYFKKSFENNITCNSIFSNILGAIVLSASSNNIFCKNDVMNNSQSVLYNPSIWLKDSSLFNNICANNITENNSYGILLEVNCSFNNINRNVITSNLKAGIKLESASYNDILKNIIANNSDGIHVMSWLWPNVQSSYNVISENTVSTNGNGIYIEGYNSLNNTLIGNLITANNYGLLIQSSSNNKIYHNNFVNNTNQAYANSMNVWDDGYPSGGNYWSDYAGVDLFSGPFQNETDSDGIGDTPYVIDENNVDRYPLMTPWTIAPPSAVINATVNINPKTLNLRSKGKWITAYIGLPEGYDVAGINFSSIMLNDTIPVEPKPIVVEDYANDSIPGLMVKFDRAKVIQYISESVNIRERFTTITLTISGKLNDGTPFQGNTTIRIIMPMSRIRCWRFTKNLQTFPI